MIFYIVLIDVAQIKESGIRMPIKVLRFVLHVYSRICVAKRTGGRISNRQRKDIEMKFILSRMI